MYKRVFRSCDSGVHIATFGAREHTKDTTGPWGSPRWSKIRGESAEFIGVVGGLIEAFVVVVGGSR